MCQPGSSRAGPGWAPRGAPFADRACDWLTASRCPLCQQVLQELWGGEVTLAWQGGSPGHLQSPACPCGGAP